jgi:putative transposase
MRKKGSPAEWERVRLIAANMFDLGKPPAEVAACTGVAAQTARRWRRQYQSGGRPALAARKPPGGPAKLSPQQRTALPGLLAQGPAAHGYDAHLWTTKLVARLILERFGVSHHHDHVGVLLHGLGWSPQLPVRRAKERDEAAVARWRGEVWPALKKKSSAAAE